MARKTRDPNRKPWFWGFVGKTALATVVAVVTLWIMGLVSLLLFGGAVLGLLGMNSGSEPDPTEQSEPYDFPTFDDEPTDAATDTAIGPPPIEDPAQVVPIVLTATSDVPVNVYWAIGDETGEDTFTGEWTMEGTTDNFDGEPFTLTLTPVDEYGETTCEIRADGVVVESSDTYCYA